MDKTTEQPEPIFPPFEEPKRTIPYPALTIGGYILLAVALMVTCQATGYSDDATNRLLEHLGARLFAVSLIFILLSRITGTHVIERYSRTEMNKSHFYAFLMASVFAIIGMILLARHQFASMQDTCFEFITFLIAYSIGYEYRFITSRRQPDA